MKAGTEKEGHIPFRGKLLKLTLSIGATLVVVGNIFAQQANPSISSISPVWMRTSTTYHDLVVNGSGFESNCILSFVDPSGQTITSSSNRLTLVSGSQIEYEFLDGNDIGEWKVSVINPGPYSSNVISFFVVKATADTFGTPLGSFNGVESFSNGYPTIYETGKWNFAQSGDTTGIKWQCVEYVDRYYDTIYHVDLQSKGIYGNADGFYANYDKSPSSGLERFPNLGTTPPKIGDILCFSSSPTGTGHVAIVRYVGPSSILAIQENVGENWHDTSWVYPLTVSNGTYSVDGSSLDAGGVVYTCLGWLRMPSTACSIFVGQGVTGAENSTFQNAYTNADGKITLGCASNVVQTNGFISSQGTSADYQLFDQGAIEYIKTGSLAGSAFAVVNPVYTKWSSLGLNSANHVGYPIQNLSSQSTSSHGTSFQYQEFETGELVYSESGPNLGNVFEVDGPIFNKWKTLDYAASPLGLPTSDVYNTSPSGVSGQAGRMSNFEGGHIFFMNGASQAYSTRGAIDQLYMQMDGVSSWLGFPTSDEYTASTGYQRSDFEGGYITSTNGSTYQAYHNSTTVTRTYTLSQGLNFVSFPFTPSPSGFNGIFPSSQFGNGVYRTAYSLNTNSTIVAAPFDASNAVAKQGYLLYVPNSSVSVTVTGVTADPGIVLHRGINLVGVTSNVIPPFNSDVYDTAIQFVNKGNSQIGVNLIPLQNGLSPGNAYFVFSDKDNNVLIPSNSSSTVQSAAARQSWQSASYKASQAARDHVSGTPSFAMRLNAAENGAPNSVSLEFGIDQGASSGYDAGIDSLMEVPVPGRMSGFIDKSYGLKIDYEPLSSVNDWPIVISSQSSAPNVNPSTSPVVLSWSIPVSGTLPPGSRLSLLDANHNLLVSDMTTIQQYAFAVNGPATSEEFIVEMTSPTAQGPPTVQTLSPTNISASSVQLNASINPHGLDTKYYFKYGTSTNYGTVTSTADAGQGSTDTSVSATVAGLLPGTLYHFQAVASSSAGTTYGGDVSFTAPQSNQVLFTTSPTSLSFTASQGGSNPASQILNLSTTGGGTVSWTATSNQYWLALTPASGVNNQQILASVNISGLDPGSYFGKIRITSQNSPTNFIDVPFSLAIVPSGVFNFSWQYKQSMPAAQEFPVSFVYNNQFHVLSGAAHYVYDPSVNQWITLTSLPIHAGGAAVIGSNAYIIDGTTSNNLIIYNIPAATWSAGAPMPSKEMGPLVLACNGKLYLIGGTDNSLNGLNTVDIYDPSSNTWSEGKPMPVSMGFEAGAVVNNLIYVMGGTNNSDAQSVQQAVEIYDPSTDSWSSGGLMPAPTTNAASCVLNGKIYIIGGMGPNNTMYRSVEEYDPTLNTWRSASPIQTARELEVAGVINGNVYVSGGYDGVNPLASLEEGTPTAQNPVISVNPGSISFSVLKNAGNLLSQIVSVSNYGGGTLNWNASTLQPWVSVRPQSGSNSGTITVSANSSGMSTGSYSDTLTITASGASNSPVRIPITLNVLAGTNYDFSWQSKMDIPLAKYGAAYASAGGKLYLFGGGGGGNTLNSYMYDAAKNTWSTLASPPTGIDEGGAAEIGGKIYVLSDFPSAPNEFYEYDTLSGTWAQGPPMPGSYRRWPCVVAVNGKLYVIGGGDGSLNVSNCDTVEIFDPGTGTWSTGNPIPTPRYGACAASVNGKIYVIGGTSGGSFLGTVVEVYNPATNTWVQKPNIPFSDPRVFASASTMNGRIYIFGGQDGFDVQNNPTIATNVLEYDPAADTIQGWSGQAWTELSPNLAPRMYLASSNINGNIYLVGGETTGSGGLPVPTSSVEEGTPTAFSISGNVGLVGSNVQVTLSSTGLLSPVQTQTATSQAGNYSFGTLLYGNYYIIPSAVGYEFEPPYQKVLISGSSQSNTNFTASQAADNVWNSQVSNTFGNLRSIDFVNGRMGWAVGGQIIVHTTNGGITWTRQILPANNYFSLYSISFADSLVGWAVDFNNGIIHTTDGGQTWNQQFSLSNQSDHIQYVACVDGSTAWAVTTQGEIIKTGNGGLTWSVKKVGNDALNAVDFLNRYDGWIAEDGMLLHSKDGGITWDTTYTAPAGSYLYGITFPDPLDGWAAGTIPGTGNNVLHTTDGGKSWSEQPTNFNSYGYQGVVASDSDLCWLYTNLADTAVVRTTDGGVTWTPQPTGTPYGLMSMSYSNNNTWAAGVDGTIIHSIVNVPRPPEIKLTSVDSISSSAATFTCTVNTNGLTGSIWIQYAQDSSFQKPATTSLLPIAASNFNQVVNLTLDALQPGTKYFCRPIASNSAGTKTGEAFVFATAASRIQSPPLLTVSRNSSYQGGPWELHWGAVPNAIGYIVQISPSTDFPPDTSLTLSSKNLAISLSTLSVNTKYFWHVEAFDSSGAISPWSASASFQTDDSTTAIIPLAAGWNLISSFVQPADTTIDSVFSGIVSELKLAKDGLGQVYWPAYGLRQFHGWNSRYGYWVNMVAPDTLSIFGAQVFPDSTLCKLAAGWNIVPYLRTAPTSPPSGFSSVAGSLVLAKDNSGDTYWPQYRINTIPALVPGAAYQLYVTSACTLRYAPNDTTIFQTKAKKTGKFSVQSVASVQLHYVPSHTKTGASATFLLQGSDLSGGDEVGVWTSNDSLVGSGMVSEQRCVVTVWGDDGLDKEHPVGALSSQTLFLTLWSGTKQKETPLEATSVMNGLTGQKLNSGVTYKTNEVLVIAVETADIPKTFLLDQNYPNPFNPTTTIRYGLPKDERVRLEIYNVLGQRVRVLVDGNQKAGYHSLLFSGAALASGVYFCRIIAGSFISTKKMLLLK